MFSRSVLFVLLGLALVAHGSALTIRAQGTTYSDPFAYCAAVGTIDAPDARYTGPPVPESVARGLQAATGATDAPLDSFVSNSFWRCADGAVYACTVGANLPCQEKADTSQTPTPAMTQYCQTNPNGAIPAFVTGSATVYEWACQNGVATPGQQVFQVDAQGFIADFWYRLTPQGLPATGATPSGTALLMLLAAGAALGGLGQLVKGRKPGMPMTFDL